MKKLSVVIFSFLLIISCIDKLDQRRKEKLSYKTLQETEVNYLPLNEFASNKDWEFSSLTWYKDNLILLPQYPSKVNGGAFLYMRKHEILESIENKTSLEPKLIKVDMTNLESFESHGSGFEAIVFKGDTVYVSIESMSLFETVAVIMMGKIDSTSLSIKFNTDKKLELPNLSGKGNLSEEAIFVDKNYLYAIHESNSYKLPQFFQIPLDLKNYKKMPFPQINYRITDVTALDDSLKFYAINYFWEGDDSDFPLEDIYAEKWGIGKSHKQFNNVERIIELKLDAKSVKITQKEPIYLRLDKNGRNWEGIVKLDDLGFLVITDKHPASILGFIPLERKN